MIKFDQLRSGKTLDELDEDSSNQVHHGAALNVQLDIFQSEPSDMNIICCLSQTEDLLKEYRDKIQDLEEELKILHQKSRSGIALRSQYSFPSQVDRGSAILPAPGADGDVLSPGADVHREVEADVVAKEIEYTSLQAGLDKELQDLNIRLEQKEVKYH